MQVDIPELLSKLLFIIAPCTMTDAVLGGIQARGGLQRKWGWRSHHESLPRKGMLPAYAAAKSVCG